jgi:hypothetical protein
LKDDVKIEAAVESKYLYAREDAMRNANLGKQSMVVSKPKEQPKNTSLLGAAKPEQLAG